MSHRLKYLSSFFGSRFGWTFIVPLLFNATIWVKQLHRQRLGNRPSHVVSPASRLEYIGLGRLLPVSIEKKKQGKTSLQDHPISPFTLDLTNSYARFRVLHDYWSWQSVDTNFKQCSLSSLTATARIACFHISYVISAASNA